MLYVRRDNMEEYAFQSFDSLDANQTENETNNSKVVNTWIEVKKIAPLNSACTGPQTSDYASIKIKPNKYHPNAYRLPGLSHKNNSNAPSPTHGNKANFDLKNTKPITQSYCCPKNLVESFNPKRSINHMDNNLVAAEKSKENKYVNKSQEENDWIERLKKLTNRNKKSYELNSTSRLLTNQSNNGVILNDSRPLDYRNDSPLIRNKPSRGTIMLRSRQMAAKLEQENDLDQNNNEKDPPNAVEVYTSSPQIIQTVHQNSFKTPVPVSNKTSIANRPQIHNHIQNREFSAELNTCNYPIEVQRQEISVKQSKSLSTSNLSVNQPQEGLKFNALKQRWTEYIHQNKSIGSPNSTNPSDQRVSMTRLCPRSLIRDSEMLMTKTTETTPKRLTKPESMAISCDNLSYITIPKECESPKRVLDKKETFWENVNRVEERKIPTKPPIFSGRNAIFAKDISMKPQMLPNHLRKISQSSRQCHEIGDDSIQYTSAKGYI